MLSATSDSAAVRNARTDLRAVCKRAGIAKVAPHTFRHTFGSWLVRTSDTTVVALSAICTHAGCTMDYDSGAHELACPCHGSMFSRTGQVVSGPAQSAVKVYNAALANNVITVS